MRLVRELLAADAELDAAGAAAAGRAARYLGVVVAGLGARAAALLAVDPASGALAPAALALPEAARAVLCPAAGAPEYPLVRRACDGHRAFLVRKSSDDPLLAALRAADPGIETLAIVPLADRRPTGVLVLAADETQLSADALRAANAAIRLLGILLSPARDAGPVRDAAPAPGLAALRAELAAERARSEGYARELEALRARVADLERAARAAAAARAPAPPVRVVAAAETTASEVDALVESLAAPAAAVADARPARRARATVIDANPVWAGVESCDAVSPGPDLVDLVLAADGERLAVNLALAGGLAGLAALRTAGIATPAWGFFADPEGERVLGAGLIEAVAHPPTLDALVGAVEHVAPRNARVFAAGRDAGLLLKMRHAVSQQGLSVSMARDAKQANELIEMVRPQVLVVDLALPLREGYELAVRATALVPVPALVLVLPDGGDPSSVLREKASEPAALERRMAARHWLTALLEEKLPASARPRAGAGAAGLTSGDRRA